jgi:uncharacterized protein (TIGR02646 family)
MRPVKKLVIGDTIKIDGKDVVIIEEYNRHQDAKPVLSANIGSYCSFCEQWVNIDYNLDVEHIQPQSKYPTLEFNWSNFLLACKRCNGKDNKTNKDVILDEIYLPHTHNTFYCIKYMEGGLVIVNPKIPITSTEYRKTKKIIDLVGLDKNPKHPDYKPKDNRWELRYEVWQLAEKYLDKLTKTTTDVDTIIDLALSRGFFSIWFTVFQDHDDVKKALIEKFTGTAAECFDASNHYEPIKRTTEM